LSSLEGDDDDDSDDQDEVAELLADVVRPNKSSATKVTHSAGSLTVSKTSEHATVGTDGE